MGWPNLPRHDPVSDCAAALLLSREAVAQTLDRVTQALPRVGPEMPKLVAARRALCSIRPLPLLAQPSQQAQPASRRRIYATSLT